MEARTVLDVLKQSALSEAVAPYDLSLSHSVPKDVDDLDSHSSSEEVQSWHGDTLSSSARTEDTDVTDRSNAIKGLQIGEVDNEETENTPFFVQWKGMPTEEKIQALQEMFPGARTVDVVYTLKKSDNNYNWAVENLLNITFLEAEIDESGNTKLKRGIEGFSEPSSSRRGRKKKSKHKKYLQTRTSSTPTSLEPRISNGSTLPSSRWNRAKEEVEFIASRIYIPRVFIRSIYHENNASFYSTIAAICRIDDFKNIYLNDAPPSLLEEQASMLASKFPNLSPPQTMALVQMTYPSTTSASELANALSSSTPASSYENIVPQYRSRPPSPGTISTPLPPSPIELPSHTSERLAEVRSTASRQAASSYRLSKSKPLMSGAAAYYSSVARDANLVLRQREASEADSLVNKQSRPGELDLHGVNVRDGVSIAARRVEIWWEADQREWARNGKAQGVSLRIITGKGQHSEGGKGRLGPAIGAMLVRKGWKIEVGSGFIDVVGKARG